MSPLDLHSHSLASDGRLSPSALLALASEAGVRVLALTDHDTVSGLEEAWRAAGASGVRLVPGVELSVSWSGRTVHVLGLGLDPANAKLGALLGDLSARRETRAEAIAAKLEKRGLRDVLQRTRELARGGQLTRTHFARLLVRDGFSRDAGHAFKHFLAPGQAAAVPSEWPPLNAAVAAIRAAGGHAVLAHPLRYKLKRSGRMKLYAEFAAAGGEAMEVSGGNIAPQQRRVLAAEAQAAGLCGSLGSDFHDPQFGWQGLGRFAPLPEALRPVWELPALRSYAQTHQVFASPSQ